MTLSEERPSFAPERIEKRCHGFDEHLKVDAASQGSLQSPGFPVAIVLLQHDLGSLQLDVHEAIFGSLIRDLETEYPAPEILALLQVKNVQLGDEPGKAPNWQSIGW
jgi:hypothetical protein